MEIAGLPAQFALLAIVVPFFALFALVEVVRPYRAMPLPRSRRWTTNLALYAIDTVAVRVFGPAAMIGAALWAQEAGYGVFNAFDMPGWLAFGATLLALDLALWVQHLATHRVPLLWRLHKVHHADTGFDVTTAARFHPVEIVLSMGFKMAVVVALGAPPLAVFAFEAIFNAFTLFGHANFGLPRGFDALVRGAFVTPDMHRIHHSTTMEETNSNYGTVLSGWDRLFGTYVARPEKGRDAVEIGLSGYRDEKPGKLGWSLALPFRRPPPGGD